MKRGLLDPAFVRESHDCAIALRRRLRGRSLIANLLQPARDARVLAAKEAAKPCDEFPHGAHRPFFAYALSPLIALKNKG